MVPLVEVMSKQERQQVAVRCLVRVQMRAEPERESALLVLLRPLAVACMPLGLAAVPVRPVAELQVLVAVRRLEPVVGLPMEPPNRTRSAAREP